MEKKLKKEHSNNESTIVRKPKMCIQVAKYLKELP